jgi:hypothetical protein
VQGSVFAWLEHGQMGDAFFMHYFYHSPDFGDHICCRIFCCVAIGVFPLIGCIWTFSAPTAGAAPRLIMCCPAATISLAGFEVIMKLHPLEHCAAQKKNMYAARIS